MTTDEVGEFWWRFYHKRPKITATIKPDFLSLSRSDRRGVYRLDCRYQNITRADIVDAAQHQDQDKVIFVFYDEARKSVCPSPMPGVTTIVDHIPFMDDENIPLGQTLLIYRKQEGLCRSMIRCLFRFMKGQNQNAC